MAWSSSSSQTPQENYEVFLSFRGEDTRHTFTSHLYAALSRLQIKTYIDYNLERGDEISATLLRAIEGSKLSVVVLSKNYASSKWCLDELVKILECKKMNGQIVVPVFYDIDPSSVRNQTGSYALAFAKHERLFKGDVKVQRWRNALAEVASLSGWDCLVNRMESETVEKIAMDVLHKLNYVYVGDLDVQIAKYEQLAGLLSSKIMGFGNPWNPQDWDQLQATNQRINQLKMEKNVRLLRLPPAN